MQSSFRRPGERTRLRGRTRECALLDGLLDSIRAGESRALVVRGEAGIGKTALLEYLIETALDVTVVRAGGVESEMELAYSNLHLLCGPMLAQLERLPGPQRQALETVFGLSVGPPPDRFLVGLGVLGLLSEAAEERPLLCVVDDAQWLDQASGLIMAFVARRLVAERVGIVFAARHPVEELSRLSRSGGARPAQWRRPRAAGLGGAVDAGPARSGPDHRRGRRQSTRFARIAARVDGDTAGGWVRAARCGGCRRTAGADLRSTTRRAFGRCEASVAACVGRASRRSAAAVACRRTARNRAGGGQDRGDERAAGDQRARDVPSSAGAVHGLSIGAARGATGRAHGAGGRDRPGDRPRPSGVASGRSRSRTRRARSPRSSSVPRAGRRPAVVSPRRRRSCIAPWR